MKKKVSRKNIKNINPNINISNKQFKKTDDVLKYFFIGIIIVIIIETLFMLLGMYFENYNGLAITGIPSSIGLTIILVIGLLLRKKSEYILLGSFSFAFVAPLILGLIIIFGAMDYNSPIIYVSIAYMIVMIAFVWFYYLKKIIKNFK
jgi:hypothetical protein